MVTFKTDDQRPSYASLVNAGHAGDLVFRVHNPTSVSPLIWTGDGRTSGFASANQHLGMLTPKAYASALGTSAAVRSREQRSRVGTTGFVGDDVPMASSSNKNANTNRSGRIPRSSTAASSLASSSIVHTVFDDDSPEFINYPGLKSKDAPTESPILASPPGRVPLPWDDWTHGPFFRQSLVDHMTRRPRLTHADVPTGTPETPPDALSPWISTSADFSWAVWEAARRLGQLGESSVEIALVALASGETTGKKPGTVANGTEVPTSTSEPPLFLSYAATTPSGGSGEVTLEPLNVLRDYQRNGTGTGDHGRMTNSEKEYVATAIFTSASSREVLFLGRIFASSVVANLEFTPSTLPIALPPHFLNRSPGPNGEDWLKQLVWDPDRDDFAAACRKIKSSETHQWRKGIHHEASWGTGDSESQAQSQTRSQGATSDLSRSVTPTPDNVRHATQNGHAKMKTTTKSVAENTLPPKPERRQDNSGWGGRSRPARRTDYARDKPWLNDEPVDNGWGSRRDTNGSTS